MKEYIVLGTDDEIEDRQPEFVAANSAEEALDNYLSDVEGDQDDYDQRGRYYVVETKRASLFEVTNTRPVFQLLLRGVS